MIPMDPESDTDADLDDPTFLGTGNISWEEHQQRQRSIRTLMMFLMMLILMEGDNPPENRKKSLRSRKNKDSKHADLVNQQLVEKRMRLDALLTSVVRMGSGFVAGSQSGSGAGVGGEMNGNTYVQDRFQQMIDLNHGMDEELLAEVHTEKYWNDILSKQEKNISNEEKKGKKLKKLIIGEAKDHFDEIGDPVAMQKAKELYEDVIEEEKQVWTYPTNATGSYRGQWKRVYHNNNATNIANRSNEDIASTSRHLDEQRNNDENNMQILSNEQILNLVNGPHQSHIGLHLLPPSTKAQELDRNTTKDSDQREKDLKSLKSYGVTNPLPLDVANDEGSVVIRLYSRSITGMLHLSLIDGIVYMYDVNNRSFASQMKHLTIRVRGVLIHSLGRMSLVANDGQSRSVFVVYNGNGVPKNGRRLMHVENGDVDGDIDVEAVRDEALQKYKHLYHGEVGGTAWRRHLQSMDVDKPVVQEVDVNPPEVMIPEQREEFNANLYVGTNPFLPDDKTDSLSEIPPKVLKSSAPLNTLNGYDCEFELEFNITETQWTVGEWREMYQKKMGAEKETYIKLLNSSSEEETQLHKASKMKNDGMDEALVMHMLGTIKSPQCDFVSNLNVTAVRTDWDATSNKAINYCFIMMCTCLAQTVFLLKQLIYSQPQSSAIRVSMLSVGWHTLLDSILCVEHVFLCLLLQPVSTAFAMVAFLKLLSFCVIEMKYMVIVMQARYNAAGETLSASELRSKVSNLHIGFYCSLVIVIFILWHLKDSHRLLCMLVLYSFWVPQIIYNVKTEARRPLHDKYVYGMSISRLVAPIYTLAIPNNFFKEIEPDFPVDYFVCQMLVLWIGIQTAILVGQKKYGARFMIPARFLPPKYDYNRPIPVHMRPKPTLIESSSDESESGTLHENDVMVCGDIGPRNRKEKRSRNGSGDSNITTINQAYARPTLDCVICYNDIDIGDRMEYMIAPCNHIFHRACLTQWMEVKMECPVCRTPLPAL